MPKKVVPRCWRCKRKLDMKGVKEGYYQLSTLVCWRCRFQLRKQGMAI